MNDTNSIYGEIMKRIKLCKTRLYNNYDLMETLVIAIGRCKNNSNINVAFDMEPKFDMLLH